MGDSSKDQKYAHIQIFEMHRQEVKNLQEKISEKGYPHAAVKGVAEFGQDRSRVFVSYHVDEGPKVMIGQPKNSSNRKWNKSNWSRNNNENALV